MKLHAMSYGSFLMDHTLCGLAFYDDGHIAASRAAVTCKRCILAGAKQERAALSVLDQRGDVK